MKTRHGLKSWFFDLWYGDNQWVDAERKRLQADVKRLEALQKKHTDDKRSLNGELCKVQRKLDKTRLYAAGQRATVERMKQQSALDHEFAAKCKTELLAVVGPTRQEVHDSVQDFIGAVVASGVVEIACFCNATAMPPCSWCTDPARTEADFNQ